MTDQDQKKGLGFRSHSAERKREKLEDRLTSHLLEKCTHEELARSTARLILERSHIREASIEAAGEVAKEVAKSVAIQAISAFKQHKKRPYQENYKGTLGLIADRLAKAKEAAKQAARELWAKDSERQIRIGAMALKVYQALHGTEHEESLPLDQSALRKWIKEVAPDYARMGGPPRKNPPDR